jgi:hypothetical protein
VCDRNFRLRCDDSSSCITGTSAKYLTTLQGCARLLAQHESDRMSGEATYRVAPAYLVAANILAALATPVAIQTAKPGCKLVGMQAVEIVD